MSPVWIVFIVLLALLVLAFFLSLWLLDTRRARQVESDPERLDQDPHHRPHGRRRRR